MQLIFAGSPSAALPSLDALASEHDVRAVLTRQDALVGRRRVLTPSVVASRADKLGLRVVKANRLTGDIVHELDATNADLGVIVAYGALLREPLLSAPRHGWINLHFSLLPAWRGAAPVQHSLIAGDRVTGVSVFQLVAELDAGPLYAREEYRPGAHQTAGSLLDALATVGADVLRRVVDGIGSGALHADPQTGTPTFAPKLSLADGLLDFGQDAETLYNRYRGVTPEPGAYGVLGGGDRVKLLEIAPVRDAVRVEARRVALVGGDVLVGTTTAPLRLITVQPAGKRAMSASDWWRGLREPEEVRFDG